eukprot:jgi/Chlat1/3687/Chrsp24S03854
MSRRSSGNFLPTCMVYVMGSSTEIPANSLADFLVVVVVVGGGGGGGGGAGSLLESFYREQLLLLLRRRRLLCVGINLYECKGDNAMQE